jgi:hypothetical protein
MLRGAPSRKPSGSKSPWIVCYDRTDTENAHQARSLIDEPEGTAVTDRG